jgi:aminomethyltransferase
MPLYGNELDESIDPLSAGLAFAVSLDRGAEFIGRGALIELRARGVERRLSGFKVRGKRIARQGMEILDGDRIAGVVTSGAPSPTLDCPIAMGYVDVAALAPDRPVELSVDVRGRREALEIAELPFYSRTERG